MSDRRPYAPGALPPPLDLAALFPYAGPANAALAEYGGILRGIVNQQVMLSPFTTQEAVLSSRIEGTQATVDEVLGYEAGVTFEPEKEHDIQEVVNYRKALVLAKESLSERTLSLSLVREIHGVLMTSVRGADKAPGAFRATQNWIGPPGCAMEEATFVPPSPLTLVDHLEAFERYLSADEVDPLVQTAIVHAQFELLHPFLDGNGRLGRLLIPLFLFQKRALASPSFYLSGYLEANRAEYYERLRRVGQDGDWTGWVAFFLRAVTEQAKTNTARVESILSLYDEMKESISRLLRSQHSIAVLDALFERPVFSSARFIERVGAPQPTVMPFLRKLREAGILRVIRAKSGRTAAIFAFPELLNRAEGRRVL